MLGWVQVVRSTDNESGGDRFELDPFGLFGDAPSPYCWYGQRPAPLRRSVVFGPRTSGMGGAQLSGNESPLTRLRS